MEEMKDLKDAELISKTLDGVQPAFGILVERYAGRLFSFLKPKVLDFHLTEDLVQDTFVKAYENLPSYTPRYKFSTWVYTIGYRLWVSECRKKSHKSVAVEVDSLVSRESPDQKISSIEGAEFLWSCVKLLPGKQYEILWLRYQEDLTPDEICQILRINRVYYKVLVFRARKALLQKIRNSKKKSTLEGFSGFEALNKL